MKIELFGIWEMWENGIIYVDTKTYVGMPFVRRQRWYEFEMFDVNCRYGSYGVKIALLLIVHIKYMCS